MAFATINNNKIHYQILGKGNPRKIVFLHGLAMDNLSSWFFTFANPVAQHAEVLLYDMRGHGKSGRPKSGYTINDLVNELDALLTHVGYDEPVYLAGNSFGGLVALNFAQQMPQRTAGLLLIESHLNLPGWSQYMVDCLSVEGEAWETMIKTVFKDWMGRHSSRKRTKLGDCTTELMNNTELLNDLSNSPALQLSQIRKIQTPTLVLYGMDSDVIHFSKVLDDYMPNSCVELLADCSHSIMWEKTDWLRQRICDWVQSLPITTPEEPLPLQALEA